MNFFALPKMANSSAFVLPAPCAYTRLVPPSFFLIRSRTCRGDRTGSTSKRREENRERTSSTEKGGGERRAHFFARTLERVQATDECPRHRELLHLRSPSHRASLVPQHVHGKVLAIVCARFAQARRRERGAALAQELEAGQEEYVYDARRVVRRLEFASQHVVEVKHDVGTWGAQRRGGISTFFCE